MDRRAQRLGIGRLRPHVIGAPICVDDQIGDNVRPGRLDQDMDLLGGRGPALGIADDPSHGVTGRDRARADELLAFLQGKSVTCPGAA